MATILDMSFLSGRCYNDSSSFTDPKDFYPMLMERADGEFYGAAYTAPANVIAIAFRGTEATAGDVFTDASLMMGNSQLANAISFADKVMNTFGGRYKYAFTGHSLGGALAQAACSVHAKPTVSFNGPGLQPGMMTGALSCFVNAAGMVTRNMSLGIMYQSLDNFCTHVRHENDPVSGIGHLRGRVYNLKGRGEGNLDAHRMGNVHKILGNDYASLACKNVWRSG
jgi:Protein of unknown function (DUF2974)